MLVAEIQRSMELIFGECEEEGEFREHCTRLKFGLMNFSPRKEWLLFPETKDEILGCGLKIIALLNVDQGTNHGSCLSLYCYAPPISILTAERINRVNEDNHQSILSFNNNDQLVLRFSSGVLEAEMSPRMLHSFLYFWILDVWNFWLFLSNND